MSNLKETCITCNEDKNATDYYIYDSIDNKYHNHCKQCHNNNKKGSVLVSQEYLYFVHSLIIHIYLRERVRA